MARGFRMGGAGGVLAKKNLLSPINSLVLTQPSNTANINTTKRTFSKNSYTLGLTSGNYYDSSKITSFTINSNNEFTIKSTDVNSVGFVLNSNVQTQHTYQVNFTNITSSVSIRIMFYQADGTFINYIANDTFTVPSNADYVVVNFRPDALNTDITVRIDSIIEI